MRFDRIHYLVLGLLFTIFVLSKVGYFIEPATGVHSVFTTESEQEIETGSLLVQAIVVISASIALLGKRYRQSLYLIKADVVVALYILFCLLSLFYSASPSITLRRLIFALVVLFIGYALANAPKEPFEKLLRVLYFFLLAYTFIGVLGLIRSAVQGHSFFQTPFTVFDASHRDGEMFSVAFLLHWHLMKKKARGVSSMLVIGILGVLILLTLSRTSILGLIIAFGYIALASSTRKTSVAFQVVSLISVVSIIILILPSTAIQGILRPESVETLMGRTILWDFMITAVSVNPLIGEGFGAFWSPDNIFDMQQFQNWGITTAHNGFFDVYLNTGIIGLIFVCLLIIRFWMYASKLPVAERVFVRSVLVFIIAQNLTQGSFQNPRNFLEVLFWWMYAGIGVHVARLGAESNHSSESKLIVGVQGAVQ